MPIRAAHVEDVPEIRRCVIEAYSRYAVRLDRPPAPLFDDYEAEVRAGIVFVDADPEVRGVVVLIPAADHLLLQNLAVHPEVQGQGIGSRLLEFAESRTLELGLPELRLYTNERMTENRAYYIAHGYRETARAEQDSYARIFFAKSLPPPRTRAPGA